MKLVDEILDYSSRDCGLQLLSISAERGERDEVWSTPVDHTQALSPFCRYETTIQSVDVYDSTFIIS